MGDIVTERLSESFVDLMDYSFTADMEKTLDEIADGKRFGQMFLTNSILILIQNSLWLNLPLKREG